MPATRNRLSNTKDTPPAERLSWESPSIRWCGCGVRVFLSPVPTNHSLHAQCSAGHRSPRSSFSYSTGVNKHPAVVTLTPPTPVSWGRGGTEAGHRTRTPVMSWERDSSRPHTAVSLELKTHRAEGPPGTDGLARRDCFFSRARNRASRAASASPISSDSRCF